MTVRSMIDNVIKQSSTLKAHENENLRLSHELQMLRSQYQQEVDKTQQCLVQVDLLKKQNEVLARQNRTLSQKNEQLEERNKHLQQEKAELADSANTQIASMIRQRDHQESDRPTNTLEITGKSQSIVRARPTGSKNRGTSYVPIIVPTTPSSMVSRTTLHSRADKLKEVSYSNSPLCHLVKE